MRRAHLALAIQATVSGIVVVTMTLLWAATGGGSFWPKWVWLALAIPMGVHAALFGAAQGKPRRRRRAAVASDPDRGARRRARPSRRARGPARAARAGARRARGRAHAHPARRARRPGPRAAPDRARPARRRSGAARRPDDAARPRR